MRLTLLDIGELGPCADGYLRLCNQLIGWPLDKPFDVVDLIGGVNTRDDIIWLLRQMGYETKEFAYFCYFELHRKPARTKDQLEAKLNAKLKEIVATI